MNYNDFSGEINRMAPNMRSSLMALNSNSNQNSSSRPCLRKCQKLDQDEYNESGKPLELPYNSSGLPLRYLNLNRIGCPDVRDTYNTSGKVFQLSDFLRDDARDGQGAFETYNTSGRVLHLSDLPEEETGVFSSVARGIDPQTYETLRFRQGGWETYDASGLPLIIPKFTDVRTNDLSDTDRVCDFQKRSAYGNTEKHTNSDSWNTRQTEKTQNGAGSSLEQLQCPQVPSERVWNASNLCRTTKYARYPRCPQLREGISQLDQSRQYARYSIPRWEPFTCTQDMPECSHLSQRQFVELLKKRHVDTTTSNNYFEIPLFDALVRDNYYPGAIEDAVNGQIKFNKIAFDAVFNSAPPMEIKPDDVPLTLLEAFELRIRFEDNTRTIPSSRSRCFAFRKEEEVIESKDETEETAKIPDKLQFWVHPDELKLASTVDIDLESNVREYPETALTRAIASLFKAEKMNEFDQKVHMAEEAMRSVPQDQQEKAALTSTPSFKLNLQKGEKVTTKSYKPIEIVSYIGTTKPNE